MTERKIIGEGMKEFGIGDRVKMSAKFLSTLSPKDRRNEKLRRYTVTAASEGSDGTVFIEMVDGRDREIGTTAGWLEAAEV